MVVTFVYVRKTEFLQEKLLPINNEESTGC